MLLLFLFLNPFLRLPPHHSFLASMLIEITCRLLNTSFPVLTANQLGLLPQSSLLYILAILCSLLLWGSPVLVRNPQIMSSSSNLSPDTQAHVHNHLTDICPKQTINQSIKPSCHHLFFSQVRKLRTTKSLAWKPSYEHMMILPPPTLTTILVWHMEISRQGVKLELQLLAYATATAVQESHVCNLHHSSQQCRILHRVRPGIKHTSL